MLRRGVPLFSAGTLLLGAAVLLSPEAVIAQHHGGGHGMGSTPGGLSRPTGLDEKDTLKDFHEALAVQGTSQQVAEFQALIKTIEGTQAVLHLFQQPSSAANGADRVTQEALDQALENTRNASRRFQEGFSTAQKSGLKDISKRIAKSDSDLEQEQKKLDQSLEAKAAGPEVAARGESVDKALGDFYDLQLSLGREMSITLASGQDLTFTLPQVKSPVSIENRTITVSVSGALEQVADQGGQRTFKLALISDLSDLQQEITEVLRAQLDTAQTCGQRVAIRQAALTPSTPASLLLVKLHFERWACMRSFGQETANELAEGDGTVEMKLTAAMENGALKVTAAFSRIDATGMMAESLRSGSLGEDLRDKASRSVLAAARAGTDFKIALPPAVQNSAVIQSARFQDAGVGGLTVVFDGQIEISNEQANQLASQLNQALAAQGAQPGTVPQLTKRPQ